MPRITNEQKMQSVKDFLAENGIAYKEDYISSWHFINRLKIY